MSQAYKIDPAHSTAQFVVKHMMITNVRGAFSNVQGSVVWDAANPDQSKVDVVIDANTIQTHEPDRDKHLRSADFLEVEKFPVINFKSTSVKSAGEGELNITGDLNIHGVTKPVLLKVEGPTAETKDPWGNVRIGASGTTKIKRSDFGLKWNAALEAGGFLVGDEVKIELEVSLIKA
jgi:polyisoprenoid-binding protein YceI